jgi:hypothetical protein
VRESEVNAKEVEFFRALRSNYPEMGSGEIDGAI